MKDTAGMSPWDYAGLEKPVQHAVEACQFTHGVGQYRKEVAESCVVQGSIDDGVATREGSDAADDYEWVDNSDASFHRVSHIHLDQTASQCVGWRSENGV